MTDSARFEFGKNWQKYAIHVDEAKLELAKKSLVDMLETENLSGKRFLDIGSGSGLFSAAAVQLGGKVHSFDLDQLSVSCTKDLRRRFSPDCSDWVVQQGSALDADFMTGLGHFDVVYSWGVLHHTGDMWRAMGLACERVGEGGQLFLALYNDQGWLSAWWRTVKCLYNVNIVFRVVFLTLFCPYFVGVRWTIGSFRNMETAGRGMVLWYDLKDWLGGYPFETARPGDVVAFMRKKGFELGKLTTAGGRHGCNEYVFLKRN